MLTNLFTQPARGPAKDPFIWRSIFQCHPVHCFNITVCLELPIKVSLTGSMNQLSYSVQSILCNLLKAMLDVFLYFPYSPLYNLSAVLAGDPVYARPCPSQLRRRVVHWWA